MRKLLSKLGLSLLIGGGMLYLASRQLSFAGIWASLASAHWNVLFPFLVCMTAQQFFRAWRWGQLLAPIHPVPFRRLLPISSVGFFAILALPLRMGEFVRPYLIADPPALRLSHGLGTLAVERVFDGLLLSLGAFTAVAVAKARGTTVPAWIFVAGLVALGLFLAALVVLVMTLCQRDRAVVLCRRLFGIISARLADRAAHVAEGIVDGFRVLPMWRRLTAFLAATLAYWVSNGLALWVLAHGFDLGLSLGASFGLMSLIGIGIMIPAGPGFIGNFELFAEGALALYVPWEILKGHGAAFIVASHTTNAAWYVATGLLAMLSTHVSFNRMLRAPDGVTEPNA